jgi:dihydroneopterin aldolase
VEKLELGPGGVGVEIERTRGKEQPQALHGVSFAPGEGIADRGKKGSGA